MTNSIFCLCVYDKTCKGKNLWRMGFAYQIVQDPKAYIFDMNFKVVVDAAVVCKIIKTGSL